MDIEITTQKPVIAVAIKRTAVCMNGIVEAITEGYSKICGFIAEQGKQPSSAPYVAYTNGNEDFSQFDMEMGIPVDEEIPAQGELFMSKTHEGRAIATTYKGAYKDMDVAYMAMMDYAKENSLELKGIYYDFYLNDPADTPESELLTKIVYMIE